MKENLLAFSKNATIWILVALTFLVPFFFLTTSYDYFEYPKQVLIWTGALLMTFFWLLSFALGAKNKIIRTPMDLALMIFLGVIAISAYLAIYKYPAIMGTIGRPHPGLVSFVAYTLILYVGLSAIEKLADIKKILTGLVTGSSVLAILSILQFLGVFRTLATTTKLVPFQALALINPAASTLAAAVTLALVVPIILGWLAFVRRAKEPSQRGFSVTEILLTLALIICASVVIMLSYIPAWIALVVGVLIFAFWNRVSTLRAIGTYASASLVILILVALIFHLPFFKDNLGLFKNQPPREIQLGLKDSWVVSVHTVRDRPFFGSGFGSYSADFTRYRQVGFNLNPNWNLRFNSSYNDYLNYLAMLGIVGLLAWLFFIFRYTFFAFTKVLKGADKVEHSLKVGLVGSVLAFFVATLFTSSNSTIFFVFLIGMLLSLALEKIAGAGLPELKISSTYSDVVSSRAQPLVIAIPGILLIGAAFFFGGKTVYANYAYRQALGSAQTNNVAGVITNLQTAIRLDPYVDLYHSELARSAFVIANALARRPELTDADRQRVTAFIRTAIDQATIAATRLDPINVSNWETLASIYRGVSRDNRQIINQSLQVLAQANSLDPTNPQIRLAIGAIFYQAGQYDEAAQLFGQAVNLKPDFANAHYNLANAYSKQEKYNQAFAQYEAIKKLVQPGTPDYEKVEQEQSAIRDKVTTQEAPASGEPAPTQTATESAQP